MTTRLNLLAASMLTALAFGAAAQAQPAPPPPPPGMAAPRPMRDPAERLRTVLQLRPQQEAALQAFVTAVRPDMGKMHEAMAERREAPQAVTTPERIALRQKMAAGHQARAAARDAATLAFYGQLDARQKAAFDALGDRRGRMGHMRHMGPRPGPMGAPPAH
jgi:Spy/CpxP family protein refolding chaperone